MGKYKSVRTQCDTLYFKQFIYLFSVYLTLTKAISLTQPALGC